MAKGPKNIVKKLGESIGDIYGVGDVVDRLSIVNIKIFQLESKIKTYKDLSNEEIGKMAKQIRLLNKDRIACKNLLNLLTNTGLSEVKINHVSE